MTNRITIIAVVAVVLFGHSMQLAQSFQTEDDLCTQEYSKFLVAQQVSESRSVSDPGKRIKILIRSAEFLWRHDEPTAREHFANAYNLAATHFREKGIEERRLENAGGLRSFVQDHRLEVIRAIAKLDGVWARKLVEQVLAGFEKAAKDRDEYGQTREIRVMLYIATENADKDTDLAWYLFRRVMRYPLDYHWYHTLYLLADVNLSMANALYAELLVTYRTASPRRLLFLSAYPFATDRIMGIDKYNFGVTRPAEVVPEPDLQRRFLEVFFDRIAAAASNPEERLRPADQYRQPEAVYMITALRDLEPWIMADLPFLLPRYAVARSQAMSLLTDEMRQQMEKREGFDEGFGATFDELLERVEEAFEKGTLRDGMIIQMITRSDLTEPQFIALLPWLDRIKDANLQSGGTDYYWFRRSKLAITQSRFKDAKSHAQKVSTVEHRAILAFDLAEAELESINDSASAYQTLNDVAKLVRTIDDSATKAKLLLGLAHQYERINHGFALEELAAAVRVINKLDSPDLTSSAAFSYIKGKDYQFYAGYQVPGYNLETTFNLIGKSDFGMAL